ncbi:MAG: M28 family peptidase [Acidobacteria bacterium]|nr:M28 family peptidase [Acidobacteriota bacterium]
MASFYSPKTATLAKLALISTLLLAPLSNTAAGPPAGPDAKPVVQADRWLADARHLSSDQMKGRGDGMPELNKAANYIAQEFQKAGLKPLTGGWFQPFHVVVGADLGKQNKLVMTNSKKISYRLRRDYTPLGFSGTANVTAGVVFVGYGIVAPEYQYDDYANLDVHGKAVLVLRHEPQEASDASVFSGRRMTRHAEFLSKAVIARNHGAVALIVVNDPANHAGAGSGDNDKLVPFGESTGPGDAGIPVIQVKQAVAEAWLRAAGKSLRGLQSAIDADLSNHSFVLPDTLRLQVSTEVKKRDAGLKNVVGFLPGNDPKMRDEVIVIGGHYDHLGLGDNGSMAQNLRGQIHYGADDNASGTAGVMELARLFVAEKSNRRSLLFMAYAGEEMGLLGSAHYVANPMLPLDRTVAMLNLDMIGRAKGNKLYMGGVGTSPDFRRIVSEENVNASNSAANGAGPGFDIDYNDSGYDASDHMSFARHNIPVMFFFTGLHSDYHRPSDTWDKLVPEPTARVLNLAAGITRRIDSNDARPVYTAVERPRRGQGQPQGQGDQGAPSSGYGAYFGSVPDFGQSVAGVKFDDVRADSPAAKAGLKAGDVMIKFDGQTVNNLDEFSYLLSGKRPGDTVDVVVQRNGQEVSAKVTLAERP